MNDLVNTDRCIELFAQLKLGMILDRAETRRLLQKWQQREGLRTR